MLVASLLLTACAATTPTTQHLSNSGIISPMSSLEHDWGKINIEGGKVSQTFEFQNTDSADLAIQGAVTSCMCTVAVVELADGTQSPAFGMHENKDWQGIVKPNEKFKVTATFDPMAHGPQGTGMMKRVVYLFSSSKANGEFTKPSNHGEHGNVMVTEMKVQAEVLSKADFEKEKPAIAQGPFLFSETEFDFGVVKQSGPIVERKFSFEYTGEQPITVTSTPTSCACTTAEISSKTFKKGDKGVLTVKFDPNLHEEPQGKFFKTVTLLTDPKLSTQPEVKIWAEVNLDLGADAYKLKEQHVD